MTYPDPLVQSALTDLVAGVRLDLGERHEDFTEAAAMTKVRFSPRFRFFSADGKRLLREWSGWLLPTELVAEMRIARGEDALHRAAFEDAVKEFDAALEISPEGPAVAEALYQRGMSAFIAGKFDWEPLRRDWQAVVEGFPGTRWARHAEVIADAPA